MQSISRILALLLLFGTARTAAAHFLWLEIEPAGKPEQVNLWFSESFEPGDATLLDKVANTKVSIHGADGAEHPLELQKQVNQEQGAWTASIATADRDAKTGCINATCDYGIVNRGGTFLLEYYARHLSALDAKNAAAFPLNVAARQENNAMVLNVDFQGKPATDAQLFVTGPDRVEQEVKLDANGSARIEKPAAGAYAVRAGLHQKQSGERDGKKYDEVRHWSTLTFETTGQALSAAPKKDAKENLLAENTAAVPAKEAPSAADPAAAEMLRKARETRAVWENFPGFTADVTVDIDGKQEHGKLSVDDASVASVELSDKTLQAWTEEQAGSLVQHRLPSGFADEKPTFADEEKDHPLGRLIRLGDSDYGSVYRIRDNQVMEVNRHAGPVRFTISVLESEKNKDGKYLPRVFNMTTWDEKTNEVKSTSSYLNTWTRVGNFDFPQHILEIESEPNNRHVRELTFTNYRLTEPAKK
jgi:hypothetical protein